jgi:hypothetical protein
VGSEDAGDGAAANADQQEIIVDLNPLLAARGSFQAGMPVIANDVPTLSYREPVAMLPAGLGHRLAAPAFSLITTLPLGFTMTWVEAAV